MERVDAARITALRGPKGDKGDPGDGLQIDGKALNVSGLPAAPEEGAQWLVVDDLYSFIDGEWVNYGPLRGPQGIPGPGVAHVGTLPPAASDLGSLWFDPDAESEGYSLTDVIERVDQSLSEDGTLRPIVLEHATNVVVAAANAVVDTVPGMVPPLVYDALASDSAPATAAAIAASDAIDAEIIGRDLLEGAAILEGDIAFAVVDEDGRRTWLEAGMDGGLTDHAVNKISEHIAGAVDQDTAASGLSFAVVDEDGRRTWLEADAEGKPTARAMELIGLGSATATPDYPTGDWAHWGDSLTAGGWVALMNAYTGADHANNGQGGQIANQIAARQGGGPASVTVTGNTIPASGAVAVTAMTRTPLSNGYSMLGTLAGVAGRLAADAGGNHTFTRTYAGAAVGIAEGSLFLTDVSQMYRDRIATIWMGRNDYTDPANLVQNTQAMIDYLSPKVRRVMVMEIPPASSEITGNSNRLILDVANNALASAFAPYWLPLTAWLGTPEAEAASEVTFTTDDDADIANGVVPRSLKGDPIHFNPSGNKAIAYRVFTQAQARGWL